MTHHKPFLFFLKKTKADAEKTKQQSLSDISPQPEIPEKRENSFRTENRESGSAGQDTSRVHQDKEKLYSPKEQFIRKTADAFFGNGQSLLQDSSENNRRDRYAVMTDILQLLEDYLKFLDKIAKTWIYTDICSHPDSLKAEDGKLEFCYRTESGTCYDGGSYSHETTFYTLCVEILPDEVLEADRTKVKIKTDGYYPGYYESRDDLFEEYLSDRTHLSAFTYRGDLYLSHLFGTGINLKVSEHVW